MPARAADRSTVTPPLLALRYRVSVNKVLAWIASGELRATNVATRPNGNPRWIISEEEIARFEAARASAPTSPPAQRVRRQPPGVKEFF